MQVVIYGTNLKEHDIPHVQLLFNVLHDKGVNTFVYAPYLEQLKGHIVFPRDIGIVESYKDFFVRRVDFVITLGGDGTMLNATLLVRDTQIPILGINLGRLGFLASIEKARIEEAIHLLSRNMYSIEERTLIQLETEAALFGDMPFALNDFTLLKRDTSSMITIHTYINGEFLNTYWADGIIVATPTGSTGYSLSCGGPIVFPNSNNFVVTPVAPHNLNVRPIVIPDHAVISFEVEGRADNFLCTLDSRFETITTTHQLAIRKCDFVVKMVQLPEASFMQTIRGKLAWGADRRN